MPTFTAIALDRLIDSGTSKSMTTVKSVPDPKLERRNGDPAAKPDMGLPPSNPQPGRRNSTPSTTTIDNKHYWAQITPALYATPEPTPLPDSPSSFPPSPYIINHKRRGPRLIKSLSEDDVASRKLAVDEEKAGQNVENAGKEVTVLAKDVLLKVSIPGNPTGEQNVNGTCSLELGSCSNLVNDLAIQNNSTAQNHLAVQNGSPKCAPFDLERENELDDFLDPQDSASAKSNGGENGVELERSLNLTTPAAEFFDAWDELSSEGGQQSSQRDIEAELRETRLSLLMEIEKQKQAEEAVDNMRSQWQRLWQQLSLVGLKLPMEPITLAENEQLGVDPAEDLCDQLYVARFVSNSIGWATAKAEIEMEMEAQIESKNFEIARLWDKLHYYEGVNHEMSQRNQEAVETARRLRQRRKRRQRWVWGSVAAAVVIGTGALAWSYGPSSRNQSIVPDHHPADK